MTAYEMRISDWSSDVCSSDLPAIAEEAGGESAGSAHGVRRRAGRLAAVRGVEGAASSARADHLGRNGALTRRGRARAVPPGPSRDDLEADRKIVRVGKECVRTCRYRW